MFNIPVNSFYMMLFVIALLVIGSIMCVILKLKNQGKDYTELIKRTQSWWWMIALVFLILIINKYVAIVFFAFISFLALKEFFSVVPTRQTDRRVIFWVYLAIPIQYYWIAANWYGMFVIFIPVYIFLFIPLRMVLIGETKGFIRSAGILHWAVMLTVYCLSHIAYLLMLSPVKNENAGNIGLVLFLLFMTQFNDVSQYIWGKMLGKHKILPKVSPNKTWAGFLGGVFNVAVGAAIIGPLLTPLTFYNSILAGIIIAISGFIGDTVISSIKRDLHIKDTGTVIPGHGGILDRLDSLTYTAPLFFHFLYYMAY